MPLSRKNHERIAICISQAKDEGNNMCFGNILVEKLITYLKEDNPKFDEKIFREWTK